MTKFRTLSFVMFFAALFSFFSTAFASDFHHLVRSGNLEKVKAEIAKDKRLVNLTDELGRNPLQLACEHGYLAMVNVLIKAGADINHIDRLKGFSALHYAALRNNPKVLSFLLSRGADMTIQDSEGNFPLHYCAANGCVETVTILVDHQADVNCMNRHWQIPLHLCAFAGQKIQQFPFASQKPNEYLRVAEILVANGAFAGLRDIYDDTPTTIAARHTGDFLKQFLEIVKRTE